MVESTFFIGLYPTGIAVQLDGCYLLIRVLNRIAAEILSMLCNSNQYLTKLQFPSPLYFLQSFYIHLISKMKSVIALALVGSAAAFAPQSQGPVSIDFIMHTIDTCGYCKRSYLILKNFGFCAIFFSSFCGLV